MPSASPSRGVSLDARKNDNERSPAADAMDDMDTMDVTDVMDVIDAYRCDGCL
jgi:hypothetical protein